jgi:hypothetical protein
MLKGIQHLIDFLCFSSCPLNIYGKIIIFPRAFFLPHVPLKIFPEILDRALERLDRTGRESTVCIAGSEQFTLLFQDIDVAKLTVTVFDRMEHFFEPRQAFTAGCAPTAGLTGKEFNEVMREPHRTGLIIKDDHRSGAEAASGLHH